jgi:hypothetical protein
MMDPAPNSPKRIPKSTKSGRLCNCSSSQTPAKMLTPRQKAMEKPKPDTKDKARRVFGSNLINLFALISPRTPRRLRRKHSEETSLITRSGIIPSSLIVGKFFSDWGATEIFGKLTDQPMRQHILHPYRTHHSNRISGSYEELSYLKLLMDPDLPAFCY